MSVDFIGRGWAFPMAVGHDGAPVGRPVLREEEREVLGGLDLVPDLEAPRRPAAAEDLLEPPPVEGAHGVRGAGAIFRETSSQGAEWVIAPVLIRSTPDSA